MFFTIHSVLGLPGPDDLDWVDDVLTALSGTRVPSGVLVARTDDEARGHAVLLWRSREQAGHCADISGEAGTVRLGAGSVFGYTAHGAGSDGPARYLQIVQFTGPRSPEWVGAHERAGRERIAPAVRDVPGQIGALDGRAEDGGTVTLVLAETTEAIDEAVRRIMATALLPGERQELLTGPDRIEIQRLVHADLPESVFAGSAATTAGSR